MERKERKAQPVNEQPAGRTPQDWARGAGIGRTTLYTLPEDCWPARTRIGRRLVIIESPADWLARMAARGGVETTKAKVAA